MTLDAISVQVLVLPSAPTVWMDTTSMPTTTAWHALMAATAQSVQPLMLLVASLASQDIS